MYTIYHLICPKSLEVRYVGQTKHTTSVRLLQHIKKSKAKTGRQYHVNFWIQSLLLEELQPIIISVATNLNKEEANNYEQAEISRLLAEGKNLCNLTSGGDSFEMSELTKQRMRESKLGIKNSFYGRKHTEETKQLIALAAKGKTPSKETREKLRIAFSGAKNYFFGKHHNETTKRKLSEKRQKAFVVFIS